MEKIMKPNEREISLPIEKKKKKNAPCLQDFVNCGKKTAFGIPMVQGMVSDSAKFYIDFVT